MIDIITPQRFYQFKFKENSDGNDIDSVIDLKVITQISLIHKSKYDNKDMIMIETNLQSPPIYVSIDTNESADEVYSKLVKAWTTYKLATER